MDQKKLGYTKSPAGYIEKTHTLAGAFRKEFGIKDTRSDLYLNQPTQHTINRFRSTSIQVCPTTPVKQSYAGYYIKSAGDPTEKQKRPATSNANYEYALNDYHMQASQGFKTKGSLPPRGNSDVGRFFNNIARRQYASPKLSTMIPG